MQTNQISRTPFNSAVFESLVRIVGTENFHTREFELQRYYCTTIPYSRFVNAAIRPQTLEQVQEIVKISKHSGIPLYPLSTGNNWGYGSALPVTNNCMIVDLSRMNRIIEVNEELAYAVVEPGVTQGQLFEYLRSKNSKLQIDPSGAGPNTSLLGNAVERGYGLGQYGDHFAAACGMQVVLGNGETLETNFGQFENVRARHLYRWGVGPSLDGIFTQSNFGIITRMAIWLQKIPEKYEILCFANDDENCIFDIVETVRELFFQGAFSASCNLVSRNRVLTTRMQYPWKEMNYATPLSAQLSKDIASKAGIKAWNGMAPIFGTQSQINAAKKLLKKNLKKHSERIVFLSETKKYYLNKYQKVISGIMGVDIKSLLASINPLFDLLRGEPLEISMPTPYWRNKSSSPFRKNLNPAKDNCGLLWITPLIPMTKRDMKDFINLSEPIVTEHKLDFCPTFTGVSHRAFDCSLPILFDRQSEYEEEMAVKCYEKLLDVYISEGFIPYRLGVQSMSKAASQESTFWSTVEKIKSVLDPSSVISPGRYSKMSTSTEEIYGNEEKSLRSS